MKIGIFVPNIGNFGSKGFYNSQEIGLAKALANQCNEVVIFKLIAKSELKELSEEVIGEKITIIRIPSYRIGTHGLIKLKFLNKYNIEKMICFSDIQLIVKPLYNWCKENSVIFNPYVGAIESNSEKSIIRIVTKVLTKRNLNVFKRVTVYAKTQYIKDKLSKLGISDCKVAPVALDFDLLKHDFQLVSKIALKKEFGFEENDKLLLFVGRLTEEKRPFDALKILKLLEKYDHTYKLIIVGQGKLTEKIHEFVNDNQLNNKVIIIEKISNLEIWKLYHISECFLNLSSNEIFGMALLEAMYYKCPVVANVAPGPSFIIQNNINGILIDDNNLKKYRDAILKLQSIGNHISYNAHEHIINNLSWNNSSKIMMTNEE